jgi:hypothetical protein
MRAPVMMLVVVWPDRSSAGHGAEPGRAPADSGRAPEARQWVAYRRYLRNDS